MSQRSVVGGRLDDMNISRTKTFFSRNKSINDQSMDNFVSKGPVKFATIRDKNSYSPYQRAETQSSGNRSGSMMARGINVEPLVNKLGPSRKTSDNIVANPKLLNKLTKKLTKISEGAMSPDGRKSSSAMKTSKEISESEIVLPEVSEA